MSRQAIHAHAGPVRARTGSAHAHTGSRHPELVSGSRSARRQMLNRVQHDVPRAHRRGYTLMEVLVVISMIAILAAILFPVFARAREQARKTTCASNLTQIGAALALYAQNWDGRFPKANNDFRPLLIYTRTIGIFYCPSDSQEHIWKKGPDGRVQPTSSYVYKGGLTNDDRADLRIASEIPMPLDAGRRSFHGEMFNVLYLGGYVKCVPADGYKPVVPPSPKPKEPSPATGPGAPPNPMMPPGGPASAPQPGQM